VTLSTQPARHPGFPVGGCVVDPSPVVWGVGWLFVLSGVVAEWGTPGPIPNPEAKPSSADGTALARVWESRSPPTSKP
jgi:hypothetical protein